MIIDNVYAVPVLDIDQCRVPWRKLAVIAFAEWEVTHREMGRKCWIAFGKKDKLMNFGIGPKIGKIKFTASTQLCNARISAPHCPI